VGGSGRQGSPWRTQTDAHPPATFAASGALSPQTAKRPGPHDQVTGRSRGGLRWPGRASAADGGPARSLLQSRAEPQGPAKGLPHAPFGPFGPPRFPGQRDELPPPALPLGPRQQVAPAFADELAANIWMQIHVTHLLPVPLTG
jgi:hypothetical protein